MTETNENPISSLNDDIEDLLLIDDEVEEQQPEGAWKILIVDDEPEVHKVTQLALKNFEFEGKVLTFINAYSGEEAKQLLDVHPDIAMILLDVVMEKDDSGLEVVNYIRASLKNEFIRIVLRTGQPGKFQESVVILSYDINDYKTKTELTKSKLLTAVVTELRTYNSIKKLENTKGELENLAQENSQLYYEAKNYSKILETEVEKHTQELKAKEARLAVSEAALRAAQKLAHLGSFECDVTTHQVTWSEELFRIFGLEPEQGEANCELIQKLIHPDDRELWSKVVEETLSLGKDDDFEFRIIRPDGSIRYLYSKRQLTKDSNNKVISVLGTIQDISDRKKTEAALQEALEAAKVASRAKSEFIANMSHELRNPLNGILGYAQILQRDTTALPKQRDSINIIYQCGYHLLTLINDLLDIAKIEAQKMELIPTEFHFPTFLFNVQQIFRLRAEQKQLTFTYQPGAQLPTAIRADEKRLRQILINLLSNAVKFTDTGTVTFKVEVIGNKRKNQQPTTNNQIRFQVEDTGIGMTPEQLSKIFLPFERVGNSVYQVEGIGLGLAISKNLVSLMGGELFVESVLGKGSVFRIDIDLPLASAEIDVIPVQSAAKIVGCQGKPHKILIVDDTAVNRSVITNLLKPIGFEVSEAANGQEGIEKATQLKPDLIITNLTMPVMNGLEMTQRLRRLPECQDTLIIASSAAVFDHNRQQSREAGCNDFIPKPICSVELLEKIQKCLGVAWITEPQVESATPNPETGNLIAPPPGELVNLYAAAKIGDIAGVEAQANHLRQLDPQYVPFANQLLRLAQEFEEQKILRLVEHYISE